MTRRRWWGLAALVVVVWAVACALLLAKAGRDLWVARDSAQLARDHLDASAIAEGSALPELRAARDHFRSAERATGNPLLAPVRVLPVVGRQVRAVHALSAAAATVADAGTDAVDRAHVALAADNGGGTARVAQIRELTQAVTVANRRVQAIDDLGPRVGLIGPLRDAHNELAERLVEAKQTLADATAGAKAGLGLLAGPRRYLVVAANPAEMRAGSGMWLSGGVLTTDDGRLELGDVSPLYLQADPPDGAVAVTDPDMKARWEPDWHPSADWRALMTSPRMPVSAELGRRMWAAAGQPKIDGVLVVDPVALAAVIRATGPVQADGRTITADEVVPLLLNGQYQGIGNTTVDKANRQDALGRIASAAFQKLDHGDWSPATLAGELAQAVQGRHLLAWSADEVEQRGWAAAGMSGELTPDSVLVSVLNRGANKLDWFLHADTEVTTVPAGDGTDVSLRVHLSNVTPAGQPNYVAGPPFGFHWPAGRYVGVVAVDVPAAATAITLEGGEVVTAGRDGPVQVVATEIGLPAGQQTEVTVHFHLASRHGRLALEPSARVPGMQWRYGTRRWEDSQRRMANF